MKDTQETTVMTMAVGLSTPTELDMMQPISPELAQDSFLSKARMIGRNMVTAVVEPIQSGFRNASEYLSDTLDKLPHPSIRSTAVGTGVALVLGGGASLALAQTRQATPNKGNSEATQTHKPSGAAIKKFVQQQVAYANWYYNSDFNPNNTNTFNIARVVISDHHLLRSGECNPSNTQKPNTKSMNDNPTKGQYVVYCKKENGKYVTWTTPPKDLVYTAQAKTVNFTGLTEHTGKSTAVFLGEEAGTPDQVIINDNKKRDSFSIKAFYENDASSTTRPIEEIVMKAVGKKATTSTYHYNNI